MTTDRTLLEDAARAAGHTLRAVIQYEDESSWYGLIASGDEYSEDFDPLNDDGDALRLAVMLGLQIRHYPIYDTPRWAVLVVDKRWSSDAERDVSDDTLVRYDGDPCAATRLAITRAAAEIGKQMREAECS